MLKFSVIMPIYNVEKDIRQCLESIENQTFKNTYKKILDLKYSRMKKIKVFQSLEILH